MRATIGFVAVALGSCAAPEPPLPTPPEARPEAAGAARYDGVYEGRLSLRLDRGAFRGDCGTGGPRVMTVQNGVASLRLYPPSSHLGATILTMPVSEDGSLAGAYGTVRFTGRILGDRLVGETTSITCLFDFEAARK